MATRKPKLTEQEIIDWWLTKYHNTNLDEVAKLHPEWMDEPQAHTREFYQKYAVTQEQHDEWNEWAFDRFVKHFKLTKTYAKRSWAFAYLNVAPQIIKEDGVK